MRIARAAGGLLLDVGASIPAGPSRGSEGDARAQELIAALLTEAFPHDAVLSEEARDSAARLSADRVWIIDPLDGTREFASGGSDWAVHVALWTRDAGRGGGAAGHLAAAAVAIPALDLVLDTSSVTPLPALADGAPIRLAVSGSRPPAVAETVCQGLNAELVPMGSAGVKVASVVRGRTEAYIHAGGQYQWDSAAPVAIARAAGLHTSRIDGSPLVYNEPDSYLPDLVVCRPEIASRILSLIGSHSATSGEDS
ncbi:MAG: inositol monophosphatase family protein [Demequina sp.]|uniref:inositol monophosphatase family protein n=1 Tax=Demequina sp. TaxID=2050685 RepID=UPI003A8C35EF